MAASDFIGGNVPPFLDRAQQEKFRQDTQRRGAAKISISYVEERWQRGVSKINDKEGDPVPIKTRTLSGYPSDANSPYNEDGAPVSFWTGARQGNSGDTALPSTNRVQENERTVNNNVL